MLIQTVKKAFNKLALVPGLKSSFEKCGHDVRVSYGCDIKGAKNIVIGNHSQIGPHALFWSTRAKVYIGNYVLLGPRVTIITGDHRTDMVGKHISEVTDNEKLVEHDADVVIKDGVWIGANVTILKGVTVGEGCVIAAGSVVTKNTSPYGIYAGTPAKKIKDRFTPEQLEKHLGLLEKK
ncbi:acyltransferase [Priestia aryabhattai]|uniref:acyltransferase n=1 Tax=Priestia aryabhattai TaxID=412384 RepID=UPI00211BC965|nr:acyltransferase [Priestia aryabhattai]MCQ9281076.1 acyltransferase [Priestia aryabhattai]MED4153850.1 acyltransferase [Priestia aryabhattai]